MRNPSRLFNKNVESSKHSFNMATLTIVTCMDCKHSCLIRYGSNPIVADCHKKPQPGNDRFPYQREVAGARRTCCMHHHTDEAKQIEQR